jgi:tetratricopeptide (TPR) repeat protein
MSRSRRISLIAGALLFVSAAVSVLLLHRIDQSRQSATLQDVLYISSPKTLKRLSLGYDGLLADIYWTRTVQYFGEQHAAGNEHLNLLAPLLEITTVLDPKLTVAYEFGANFLAAKPPNGAGEPQRAIELEKYGIQNNPDDWHLYYDLGFIYYLEFKDYAKAADAFMRGSQVPNAHPFLRVLAAQMAQHGGDIETARMLWTATYRTTHDRDIRANAAAHLRAIQVDQEVAGLEKAVSIYYNQTGRWPSSFPELESAGLIRGKPIDPLGHPYRLRPDGSVEVSDPDSLPFIKSGLPLGYVPPKLPKFLPSDYSDPNAH